MKRVFSIQGISMAYAADALVQTITFKATDDASPTFKRLGDAAEGLVRKFEAAGTGVQNSLNTMKGMSSPSVLTLPLP
jgi:hypothetical protein